LIYIGVTLLNFREHEVWHMTPYKLTTLFKVHKSFNPDKFKSDDEITNSRAGNIGDVDDIDLALGGF